MHQEQFEWAVGSNGAAGARREELRGDVVFASEHEQAQRSVELLGEGALLVTVPPPRPDVRGRLGEVIEELVERELARMGAPSPYLAAWSAMPEDAQARLADQMFRVRTVGATGLVIALGTLRAIAAPALAADDSATLRWLAGTTAEAPLIVMLDDADLLLLGYAAPLPLHTLLSRPAVVSSAPPESEHEPVILAGDDATKNDTVVAMATQEPEVEDVSPVDAASLEAEVPLVVVETVLAAEASVTAIVEEPPAPEPAPEPTITAPEEPLIAKAERRSRRVSAGIPVSKPEDAWRTWAIALGAARGPQPLAAFERLFAESYVPLANAIARGLDDPRALRAYEEFRRSFERSYTDAFATFGATNRRPRLVMDAWDIAAKHARLANARSAHVLLVDSMRFDLGCLVRDALARETTGAATLTSELLLWSALPTTTMRQLETFARGLDALRAPAGEDRDEPAPSLRGRAAEVVRRVRVGSRELYKLDVVPALLESAGTPAGVVGSLDAIASTTAEAIARHLSTLPARTLLFVVGDHGFAVDRRGEVRTGGASPEEVLVPAFSWLVGDLH